jgi:hypothetical protein
MSFWLRRGGVARQRSTARVMRCSNGKARANYAQAAGERRNWIGGGDGCLHVGLIFSNPAGRFDASGIVSCSVRRNAPPRLSVS